MSIDLIRDDINRWEIYMHTNRMIVIKIQLQINRNVPSIYINTRYEALYFHGANKAFFSQHPRARNSTNMRAYEHDPWIVCIFSHDFHLDKLLWSVRSIFYMVMWAWCIILGESKGIKTRLYNLSKHDNNNKDVYFFKKGNLFLIYLNILFMHLKIYDSKKKQNI